ncbi:MAG: AI-2E family transporter [Oscillospiraceae bacterium]|nr:AI-2E family transporter [Oscillospiraceae bacterium]
MKTENKEKSLLRVLLFAIAFYFAILRFDGLVLFAKSCFGIVKPFVIGGIIAFVINVPMVKIESLLNRTKLKKGTRIIAFLLTLTLLITVAGAFLLVVVPQLVQTISTLVDRIQVILDKIPAFLNDHSHKLTFLEEYIASLNIDWRNIGQQIITRLQTFALALVGSGSGIIGNVVSGFTTALLSIIFAIYLLMGKEKNAAALTRLSDAVFGKKISGAIHHILSLCYKSFSGFLSGQCLEAVILGTMFIVAMTIFRLPYAFLVGVVIAATALIPVFGAFIGCAVGILLIAMESPLQAVGFTVLFLVLQQIEGNIIYPRVVGNSLGLPSILVFMSVILGSSLMGVAGMLLFIPSVSVIYTLIKEFVNRKEKTE